MATVGGSTILTLSDWAKRLDPDGKVDKIVEILNETNEVLEDMLWMEGNLPTGHRSTIRTGLPTAYWRMLNQGVPNSKSRTKQIDDACGMIEVYAEVDKDLADLNGNTSSFRLSENRPFMESLNQTMATSVFYGNTETDPEQFMGLAPRFDSPTSEVGANMIDGEGTGSDNTSIWLICWGPDSVFGIYPKGSQAGIKMEDKGQVTLIDSGVGQYEGYRMHYQWKCGMTVRDWRYIVRICNIDVSELTNNAEAGADLIDLMTQAIEIPPMLKGKAAWYGNKTIRQFLRRQIVNKSNVHLSLDEVAGKKVVSFDGVPFRRCDKIVNTESAITFP
jgi:hypothetical protein